MQTAWLQQQHISWVREQLKYGDILVDTSPYSSDSSIDRGRLIRALNVDMHDAQFGDPAASISRKLLQYIQQIKEAEANYLKSFALYALSVDTEKGEFEQLEKDYILAYETLKNDVLSLSTVLSLCCSKLISLREDLAALKAQMQNKFPLAAQSTRSLQLENTYSQLQNQKLETFVSTFGDLYSLVSNLKLNDLAFKKDVVFSSEKQFAKTVEYKLKQYKENSQKILSKLEELAFCLEDKMLSSVFAKDELGGKLKTVFSCLQERVIEFKKIIESPQKNLNFLKEIQEKILIPAHQFFQPSTENIPAQNLKKAAIEFAAQYKATLATRVFQLFPFPTPDALTFFGKNGYVEDWQVGLDAYLQTTEQSRVKSDANYEKAFIAFVNLLKRNGKLETIYTLMQSQEFKQLGLAWLEGMAKSPSTNTQAIEQYIGSQLGFLFLNETHFNAEWLNSLQHPQAIFRYIGTKPSETNNASLKIEFGDVSLDPQTGVSDQLMKDAARNLDYLGIKREGMALHGSTEKPATLKELSDGIEEALTKTFSITDDLLRYKLKAFISVAGHQGGFPANVMFSFFSNLFNYQQEKCVTSIENRKYFAEMDKKDPHAIWFETQYFARMQQSSSILFLKVRQKLSWKKVEAKNDYQFTLHTPEQIRVGFVAPHTFMQQFKIMPFALKTEQKVAGNLAATKQSNQQLGPWLQALYNELKDSSCFDMESINQKFINTGVSIDAAGISLAAAVKESQVAALKDSLLTLVLERWKIGRDKLALLKTLNVLFQDEEVQLLFEQKVRNKDHIVSGLKSRDIDYMRAFCYGWSIQTQETKVAAYGRYQNPSRWYRFKRALCRWLGIKWTELPVDTRLHQQYTERFGERLFGFTRYTESVDRVQQFQLLQAHCEKIVKGNLPLKFPFTEKFWKQLDNGYSYLPAGFVVKFLENLYTLDESAKKDSIKLLTEKLPNMLSQSIADPDHNLFTVFNWIEKLLPINEALCLQILKEVRSNLNSKLDALKAALKDQTFKTCMENIKVLVENNADNPTYKEIGNVLQALFLESRYLEIPAGMAALGANDLKNVNQRLLPNPTNEIELRVTLPFGEDHSQKELDQAVLVGGESSSSGKITDHESSGSDNEEHSRDSSSQEDKQSGSSTPNSSGATAFPSISKSNSGENIESIIEGENKDNSIAKSESLVAIKEHIPPSNQEKIPAIFSGPDTFFRRGNNFTRENNFTPGVSTKPESSNSEKTPDMELTLTN